VTVVLRAVRAGEVAVYGVLTLLGLVAAVVGAGYGLFQDGHKVGPGLMPTLSGALLAVLGAVLMVRAARERRAALPEEVAEAPDEPDLFGRTQAERVRHLWVVFGLLLLTIVAVTVLGFLVAFGAFVLVVSVWVERRRVVGSLVITVSACALIYLVFELFLRVPLPQGLLGI
jgi:disulfide bond formation protein DsbB